MLCLYAGAATEEADEGTTDFTDYTEENVS